jgi:hypothetical protein
VSAEDEPGENECVWRAEVGEHNELVVPGRVVVVGEFAEGEFELGDKRAFSKPRLTMRSHFRFTEWTYK